LADGHDVEDHDISSGLTTSSAPFCNQQFWSTLDGRILKKARGVIHEQIALQAKWQFAMQVAGKLHRFFGMALSCCPVIQQR
jgi:hypothetical protein